MKSLQTLLEAALNEASKIEINSQNDDFFKTFYVQKKDTLNSINSIFKNFPTIRNLILEHYDTIIEEEFSKIYKKYIQNIFTQILSDAERNSKYLNENLLFFYKTLLKNHLNVPLSPFSRIPLFNSMKLFLENLVLKYSVYTNDNGLKTQFANYAKNNVYIQDDESSYILTLLKSSNEPMNLKDVLVDISSNSPRSFIYEFRETPKDYIVIIYHN